MTVAIPVQPIQKEQITEELVDDFVYFCRAGEDILPLLELVDSKRDLILAQTPTGLNGLFAVCGNGHVEILMEMLKYLVKEDVNVQNKEGNTVLHWACLNGHLEIVKLLLEFGVNPLIRNQGGLSAATLAEQRNHMEIVTLVLQHYDPEDDDDDAEEAIEEAVPEN